jgi:hypothetical protein
MRGTAPRPPRFRCLEQSASPTPAISPNRTYGISLPLDRLLRLDVGRPDHFAPFLGFVGDELAEIGGREREHVATEIGNPRLHIGVGKSSVDLFVELLDDLRRRILGCAEVILAARSRLKKV